MHSSGAAREQTLLSRLHLLKKTPQLPQIRQGEKRIHFQTALHLGWMDLNLKDQSFSCSILTYSLRNWSWKGTLSFRRTLYVPYDLRRFAEYSKWAGFTIWLVKMFYQPECFFFPLDVMEIPFFNFCWGFFLRSFQPFIIVQFLNTFLNYKMFVEKKKKLPSVRRLYSSQKWDRTAPVNSRNSELLLQTWILFGLCSNKPKVHFRKPEFHKNVNLSN